MNATRVIPSNRPSRLVATLIQVIITLALVLGVSYAMGVRVYVAPANGGVTVGDVGYEVYGHAGAFVCDGQC
jgi:hypothetical protein